MDQSNIDPALLDPALNGGAQGTNAANAIEVPSSPSVNAPPSPGTIAAEQKLGELPATEYVYPRSNEAQFSYGTRRDFDFEQFVRDQLIAYNRSGEHAQYPNPENQQVNPYPPATQNGDRHQGHFQGYNQNFPQAQHQNSPQGYYQNFPQGYHQNLSNVPQDLNNNTPDQTLPQGHNQNAPQDLNQNFNQDLNQGLNQNFNQGLNQNVHNGVNNNVHQGFTQNLILGYNIMLHEVPPNATAQQVPIRVQKINHNPALPPHLLMELEIAKGFPSNFDNHQGYIFEPAGADGNRTSYVPEQRWLSEDNLPYRCGLLEQPPAPASAKPGYLIDPVTKQLVAGANGNILKDLPILPRVISSKVEPWRVAAWLKGDANVTYRDIVDRFAVSVGNSKAAVEKECRRLTSAVQRWQQRYSGFNTGFRNVGKDKNDMHKEDMKLIDKRPISEEQIRFNTVWVIYRGLDGKFYMQQPIINTHQGNAQGAVWEITPMTGYSNRVAKAKADIAKIKEMAIKAGDMDWEVYWNKHKGEGFTSVYRGHEKRSCIKREPDTPDAATPNIFTMTTQAGPASTGSVSPDLDLGDLFASVEMPDSVPPPMLTTAPTGNYRKRRATEAALPDEPEHVNLSSRRSKRQMVARQPDTPSAGLSTMSRANEPASDVHTPQTRTSRKRRADDSEFVGEFSKRLHTMDKLEELFDELDEESQMEIIMEKYNQMKRTKEAKAATKKYGTAYTVSRVRNSMRNLKEVQKFASEKFGEDTILTDWMSKMAAEKEKMNMMFKTPSPRPHLPAEPAEKQLRQPEAAPRHLPSPLSSPPSESASAPASMGRRTETPITPIQRSPVQLSPGRLSPFPVVKTERPPPPSPSQSSSEATMITEGSDSNTDWPDDDQAQGSPASDYHRSLFEGDDGSGSEGSEAGQNGRLDEGFCKCLNCRFIGLQGLEHDRVVICVKCDGVAFCNEECVAQHEKGNNREHLLPDPELNIENAQATGSQLADPTDTGENTGCTPVPQLNSENTQATGSQQEDPTDTGENTQATESQQADSIDIGEDTGFQLGVQENEENTGLQHEAQENGEQHSMRTPSESPDPTEGFDQELPDAKNPSKVPLIKDHKLENREIMFYVWNDEDSSWVWLNEEITFYVAGNKALELYRAKHRIRELVAGLNNP